MKRQETRKTRGAGSALLTLNWNTTQQQLEDAMSRHTHVGTVSMVVVALFPAGARMPASVGTSQAQAPATAASAANASPELVGALSKELGATPDQAAGAAGSLFGIAKSRLKPEEFSKVAAAVPGMDSLLKAAPTAGAAVGTSGA